LLATGRGTFVGNVLTISGNSANNDSINTKIKASLQGVESELSVRITDTSPVTLTSVSIYRADGSESNEVEEGKSYPFEVWANYSDNTYANVTTQATFSFSLPSRGTFNGNVLSVLNNQETGDSGLATITATYQSYTGHLEINIKDKSIPFTFTSSWAFTESGAKKNNPSGGTRSYNAANIPAGALWSIKPNGLGLRISYEDSADCGGSNSNTQEGTASATINISQPGRIRVAWTGIAEREETGYEKAELKVDGILLGSATSPGGKLKCQMGPVVTLYSAPQGLPIAIGTHNLSISCTTRDGLYHKGAYYEFTVTIMPDNGGQ